MSSVPFENNEIFPDRPAITAKELDDLFDLRSALVLEHPLTRVVGQNPRRLFLMFELYADFVYDFTEYVSRLFITMRDDDMKSVMYENLVDEIGIGSDTEIPWKAQHGELYRQFIDTLRQTEQYADCNLDKHTDAIEQASQAISKRFYGAHASIIEDRDDLQSFAAFSTIECWVSELYAYWKRSLERIFSHPERLDMRTIDLHCMCGTEHSAALDGLLRARVQDGEDALHRIRTGIVRGMVASEQLFSDIHRELA